MNMIAKKSQCWHCRGEKYVLVYWLERILHENNLHMTDIAKIGFKNIEPELLVHCHCNIGLVLLKRDQLVRCLECEGTTWRFTDEAESAGFRWKKVVNLTSDELKALPCNYFERCPCGYEEQIPKDPQKKQAIASIFELLGKQIPRIIVPL